MDSASHKAEAHTVQLRRIVRTAHMCRGTEPDPKSQLAQREFLERALTSAGEWTRYADPKALGVLVLLGLGASDLLDRGHALVHPQGGAWAIVATVFFVLAGVAAAVTVVLVTHSLFPRLDLTGLLARDDQGAPQSRFYFREVARHGGQDAYVAAVRAQSSDALLRDMAGQVYEISVIATHKHRAAQRAYAAALFFLVAWAAARVSLAAG